MPVTSTQVSGLIGGQNAMFGNTASYAQQINPFHQGGQFPTYQNPMAGAGISPAMHPSSFFLNQGMAAAPGLIGGGVRAAIPAMSIGGMLLGGRLGGMFSPMIAAFSSLGRSFGYARGAGIGANIATMGGNIAGAGIGGIARAGLFAGAAAAPAFLATQALQYTGGQMVEGARFQNQVSGFLQNAFRFTNPASRTGMGFGATEQRQIGSMLQEMGVRDAMTTPQELLNVMQRGTNMGVFRGVQDAREFRRRFIDMKNSLQEIAQTFNATLTDALPFLQNARQMGFWTPNDITRHAQQVRQLQANTGMSTQQAQAVMGAGAQMARAIGGTGAQGAEMMARAQGMAGAALFGGTITSRQLGAAGFGTGAEGARNLGMMLAGTSTNFARSRVGRWALAALMNQEGTGLNQARLAQFAAGGMSVGRMGALARQNVRGQRAYNFVLNEEELRGQLAQAGPQATLGIVRSLVGGRLHSENARDQLITNRIIQRFMGGTKRQAKMIAEMARDMPRILSIQAARSETSLDMQERNREQIMNNRLEQFKRGLGHWWEENISGPLNKAGADLGFRIGRTWERFSDRLLGMRGRSIGLQDFAVRAMRTSAITGDLSYLRRATGGAGLLRDVLGRAPAERTLGMTLGGAVGAIAGGFGGLTGGITGAVTGAMAGWGIGERVGGLISPAGQPMLMNRGAIEARERGAAGFIGAPEARALGFGGEGQLETARRSVGARQIEQFLRSSSAIRLRGREEDNRLYAARVLRMIRGGAAGEEARALLSEEGLAPETGLARLAALQGAARGTVTEIDVRKNIKYTDPETIRTRLERDREVQTEKLVTLMRGGVEDAWWRFGGEGGIEGAPITVRGMDALREDPRGRQALLLFSQANETQDPRKKEELRNEARQILRDLSLDKDVPEEIRTITTKMQDPNDPQANEMVKMAGMLGDNLRSAQGFELRETIVTRRRRLVTRLGAKGMNQLRKAAGEVGGRLRRALGAALSTSIRGAGEHQKQMELLAQAAIATPERAAEMQQVLAAGGLGTSEIAQLLQTTQRFAAFREDQRMTVAEEEEETLKGGRGRRMGAARLGVTTLARELGWGSLGSKEVTGLITGNKRYLQGLEQKLKDSDMKQTDINDLFRIFQGGITQDEFARVGARISVSHGTETYSAKIAKEAGLKPKAEEFLRMSQRDSAETRELKLQTAFLRNMDQNIANLAEGESIVKQSKQEK